MPSFWFLIGEIQWQVILVIRRTSKQSQGSCNYEDICTANNLQNKIAEGFFSYDSGKLKV